MIKNFTIKTTTKNYPSNHRKLSVESSSSVSSDNRGKSTYKDKRSEQSSTIVGIEDSKKCQKK